MRDRKSTGKVARRGGEDGGDAQQETKLTREATK